MTKEEFMTLLITAIGTRKGFSIKYAEVDSINLYSSNDIFTATFIGDVQNFLGGCFTGITVDCDGRPYMLFTY